MAGSKVKSNACEIKIVTSATPYEITSQSATTSPPTSETYTSQSNYSISLARIATPENRVIIKFVDKNGVAFKPSAGEIIPRADRPTFATFDPYFKETKTDTAMVYEYPAKLPTFPLYTAVVSGGNYNNIFYYRIPSTFNTSNLNLNPVLGFKLWPADGEPFVSGTYIVTAKLNFATRK